jgi:hypothetical protein
MVFATKVAEGAKGPGDCPGIGAEEGRKLSAYMSRFNLEC